jgi:hypothetical protein
MSAEALNAFDAKVQWAAPTLGRIPRGFEPAMPSAGHRVALFDGDLWTRRTTFGARYRQQDRTATPCPPTAGLLSGWNVPYPDPRNAGHPIGHRTS